MLSFWDYNVWGTLLLFGVLLGSLLAGNVLKKSIPLLKNSLIPTSVLGGVMLIIVAGIYKFATGNVMFDTTFFGGDGTAKLEIITYHTLALGFIASTLKTSKNKLTKKRSVEIFNTGITTVSTYLLQGILGMTITIIASLFVTELLDASGMLLPFAYGQGSGQALNYGNIYELEHGFVGGKSFGLTLAALGFLSASFGGVIHLNLMKKSGKLNIAKKEKTTLHTDEIESPDEIPMQESVDKMTIQIALIAVAYVVTYAFMLLLGKLLPGMISTIFGFNFLIGVLVATLIKLVMRLFKKMSVLKKEYTNNFLLTRASNFFFDLMIVAGIAAIRLDIVEKYWGVILVLGVVGLVITYAYTRLISRTLFKDYNEEQFLATYGMLTGTASTGIILLREIDGDFETPAADNLVYQNFPAIVFGFPLMLLATLAPKKPILTLIIISIFFVIMNIILFRSFIFKRRSKKD